MTAHPPFAPSLRILFLSLVLGACADREPAFDEAAHRQEVEAWRAARFEGLQEPDGWLSLAGLYWLDEGENTFGSAADNDVVFPEKAPARIGTFHLADGNVRIAVAPGVEVLHEGRPVDTLALAPDTTGAPTTLALGSLHWHVIARDGRLGVRLRDYESPARAGFEGIPAYDIDPAWRLAARFERYDPPRTLQIPTILGTVSAQPSPGALVFDVDGQPHRLDVVGEPGDSTFFVIFGDRTNGGTTYEAGRYLYVDAPDAAGRVVVDFNKAYNPPCVFTPYATCPFPPPQNKLPLAVTAGEQKYVAAGVHP